MKEVPLFDARNSLSALVQEVEDTGSDILITRHGKPAARLTPAEPPVSSLRAAAASRLLALQAEARRRRPDLEPLPWETLKRWMRDEDDGGT